MILQKCREDQKILKFHPHCIIVMHELQGPDKQQWIHYCRWFTHFIHWDMAISDKVNFNDKVGLYLTGYILANMADNIVLKIPKPSVRLIHSFKSGLWYGVYRQRLTAFISFTGMVTLEHHHTAITNFTFLLEADEQDCLFQQDGVMLHRSHSATQMWHEFFGDCIISQKWWPPQSPVPRVPDFCLCGFLEDSAQTTTRINETN